MAEVRQGGERKKMSGCNRDTLRRDALQRADRAVCGRVISCGRGQERWRTELELCGCKSFDDGHRSAVLGTAPQWVRVGAVDVSVSFFDRVAWRAAKHSGNSEARLRLARKPKWRMRTKLLGSRWSRKRRRNSSRARVISF